MKYLYKVEEEHAVITGVTVSEKARQLVESESDRLYQMIVPNKLDGFPVKKIESLAVDGDVFRPYELVFLDGIEVIEDYSCLDIQPSQVRLPKTLKYLGEGAGLHWDIINLVLPRRLEYIGKKSIGLTKNLFNLSDLNITNDIFNLTNAKRKKFSFYNLGKGRIIWDLKGLNKKQRFGRKDDYFYQIVAYTTNKEKGSFELREGKGPVQFMNMIYNDDNIQPIYDIVYDALTQYKHKENIEYNKYKNELYAIEHDGFNIVEVKVPIVFRQSISVYAANTNRYQDRKYGIVKKDSRLKRWLLRIAKKIN